MADHTLAVTHRAIAAHLYTAGFELIRVESRFLPYSFSGRLPSPPTLTRLHLQTPAVWPSSASSSWSSATGSDLRRHRSDCPPVTTTVGRVEPDAGRELGRTRFLDVRRRSARDRTPALRKPLRERGVPSETDETDDSVGLLVGGLTDEQMLPVHRVQALGADRRRHDRQAGT
jgi:hypothetical protein